MMKNDIGEILLESKKISAEQLSQCRQVMQETGKSLPECILENKFASAHDVAKAFAELASVSFIEKITEKMADPELLAKIPLRFLRQHTVIPLMIDERITIVTANPRHFQPIDALNLLLGGDTDIAVATKEMIIDAINRYYPLEGAKPLVEELEEEKELPAAVELA